MNNAKLTMWHKLCPCKTAVNVLFVFALIIFICP